MRHAEASDSVEASIDAVDNRLDGQLIVQTADWPRRQRRYTVTQKTDGHLFREID